MNIKQVVQCNGCEGWSDMTEELILSGHYEYPRTWINVQDRSADLKHKNLGFCSWVCLFKYTKGLMF